MSKGGLDVQIPDIESPIEDRFGKVLLAALLSHIAMGRPHRLTLSIRTQHEVGPFRADFAMWLTLGREVIGRLVVECDGKDFHTSEAARRRDAARDMKLERLGWKTLRFSGSQIWRQAEWCATTALETLDELSRVHARLERMHRAKLPASVRALGSSLDALNACPECNPLNARPCEAHR